MKKKEEKIRQLGNKVWISMHSLALVRRNQRCKTHETIARYIASCYSWKYSTDVLVVSWEKCNRAMEEKKSQVSQFETNPPFKKNVSGAGFSSSSYSTERCLAEKSEYLIFDNHGMKQICPKRLYHYHARTSVSEGLSRLCEYCLLYTSDAADE